MKTALTYFAVLFMLCTCFACIKKDEKQIERDYLTSFLDNIEMKNTTQWVVILPGLGCQGCIQEGEAFMKDNIGNQNILFIINRIESLKILQSKIGIELKKQPNVYLDKESKLNIPTNNNIYPCIIKLRGGKINKHEFQSPKNSKAFNNLKARIQN